MRNTIKLFILFSCFLSASSGSNAQTGIRFDLAQLYQEKKLTVFNRDVGIEKEPAKTSLTLNETVGEGLVWIDGVSFSTGSIEIDLKGQDVFQHSFLGIAFHGENDEAFDAIYFRPFNFLTEDPDRRDHAVQYVCLPVYIWQKLREEQPGKFEKEINPAPEPNGWFHARIVVKEKEVLVYVNDAVAASLKVPLLGERKTGKIALYTADRSGGAFANLVVQKD